VMGPGTDQAGGQVPSSGGALLGQLAAGLRRLFGWKAEGGKVKDEKEGTNSAQPPAAIQRRPEEVEEVAALWGVKAWLGEAACAERVADAPGPVVLHLSAPTYFRGGVEPVPAAVWENPLRRVGVLLANELTGRDVSGLDLAGTRLVVLPGCD